MWGWAFQPAAPNERVALRVLVDGETLAAGIADEYRGDLHEKGHGDGACAFAIYLPPDRLDGREHTVDVVDARSGQPLLARTRVWRLDPHGVDRRRITDALFDPVFYALQAGPVADALEHYRKVGWRRGLSPHPLFDAKRYAMLQRLAPDVEPLAHFEAKGQYAGASVHALFDRPPAPGIDGKRSHPIFAYLERREAGKVEQSPFFSDADYAARHPGVTESGFLPLMHYLTYGWREGRWPHLQFIPSLFARLAALDDDVEPYGFFLDWLRERPPTLRVPAPRVSIVILNLDKTLLTLQCLFFLERHAAGHEMEIIVVDNGSRDEDFTLLCRYARGIEIVRVGANRGFGEGNNVGAEHARGELIVFLNNDVFVTKGWLQPLLDVVDADASVGAVGPKFLYPDGRLQEAGATMSACGTAVQRGKHLDPRLPLFNRTEPVDYCSAALLLVRTEAFRTVLGFDLCWDPAYYEDADLCLKLRTVGLRTVYAHRSEVVHIEHGTSGSAAINPSFRNVVTTNRLKFVERWTQDPLPDFGRDPAVVGDLAPLAGRRGASLALYTPYPLTPGGGERYLLTIAATFGRGCRCVLFTPDRYSRMRLLTLARELALDLDHVGLAPIAEAGSHERFDTFVCMGNELLPPVAGLGAVNLFHCQFPFPMAAGHHGPRWRHLDGYDGVVVNSAFTARHYRDGLERFGLAAKPVLVVPPPVPQIRLQDGSRRAAPPHRILSVGRFAPGGHCKRQDAMIEAFRGLRKRVETTTELHLAGAVGDDLPAREYLERLVEAARDLPVSFHLNPSAAQIAALHAGAALYWHLTGLGQDIAARPELFEHFGIALAEAMSAGAVPVALRGAGPSEIITDGANGVLVDSAAELVDRSAALLAGEAELARLAAAAARRTAGFAPDLFAARFAAAADQVDPPSHALLPRAAQ